MTTPAIRARRRAGYALVGLTLGILVVLVLLLLIRTWTLVDATRQTQKSNTSTVELIQDCTTPGGECYQRGESRTAAAVGDIGVLSVYAAACAATEDEAGLSTDEFAARIEHCVKRLVQAERSH